jgi:hypothetical protein
MARRPPSPDTALRTRARGWARPEVRVPADTQEDAA